MYIYIGVGRAPVYQVASFHLWSGYVLQHNMIAFRGGCCGDAAEWVEPKVQKGSDMSDKLSVDGVRIRVDVADSARCAFEKRR